VTKPDDPHADFTNTGPSTPGFRPLAGRAHIVNRGDLQDEAMQGPGSLDPKTLAPPKQPEARRWLAKRGIELEVPAGWRLLSHDARTLTFASAHDVDAHMIELSLWKLPDDIDDEKHAAAQEDQLQEAVSLRRVLEFRKHLFGQVTGHLVVGWGPDGNNTVSDEDLYLATDGTGRHAMSCRGVVARDDERQLLFVAMSSPLDQFSEARPVFDALLDKSGALR
jgi:hypothetical protein